MSNAELYEALSQNTDMTKVGIIKFLGPPTREVSDGGDGSILVYESNGESTTVATARQNNTYYNTTSHDYYTWIYLNSNDVCTQVKSNQNYKTVKEYDPGKTAGAIAGSALLGLLVFLLIMLGVTS